MNDYFVFGDVDSRDYSDIHVFDKSVDNTPKRVYEVKNIAGRNGAFYVDQGRYEDVEHSYGVVALTKSAGSNFINALVSQVGYHRLSDSFNEDEFYLATLTDAVKAKVSKSTRDVNTFDITFTRKPQRFLKSGETAVSVENGGTIINPTLFESHPLLQVWGYGEVDINDESVEVMHVPVGTIQYASTESKGGGTTSAVISKTIDTSALANTDEITVASVTARLKANKQILVGTSDITFTSGGDGEIVQNSPSTGDIAVRFTPPAFVKNTARTNTYMWRWAWTPSSPSAVSFTVSVTVTVAYTTAGKIEARMSVTSDARSVVRATNITRGEITGYSTKSALGEPLYFDLDIGEAYKIEDGQTVSVNNAVTIPAQLPTLKSGENTITYDDTITRFDVVPRWWEV